MVQTRSRVAASRNTINVKPGSSSDSDSDASIPAKRRPSTIKSPVTLRPNKTPLAKLNNEANKKKRHAGATLETPARKRAKPSAATNLEDHDENEMDEAAMEAINAFNRQTPKSRPYAIEVLLRSSGKPNPSRRRLDGTQITEIIGESPQQSTKVTRRPTPVVEDSEPEDDVVAEEEEGIDNGHQDVGRELGSPELDSSPPKPKQPERGRRFPSRMLQPGPTALAAPLRLATINNLRPLATSTRSDGEQQQQRPVLGRSILPTVEIDDDMNTPAYQGDGNLSELEEAEGSDFDNVEDERQKSDEVDEEVDEGVDEEVGDEVDDEADEVEEVLRHAKENDDAEELELDDAQLHPPINIHVPEPLDKRLIVTLESDHVNALREAMGKEQWTDLGRFWELEIYGADGLHFNANSPPATAPGKRCLRALYALRESLGGLKNPRGLESQNNALLHRQDLLNRELTNVARKVAKIRNSLKQPGIDQQPISGDTQQFIIPTMILTLRDLFMLGTIRHKPERRRALPPLPPVGKFSCITIQYVTSITKRLSFLIRDLVDHCEDEAPSVQLSWNDLSRILDEWKFELQEKIATVNEEMNRQEKIARDKAIKEHRKKLAEIELSKTTEQWNRMAASTQRIKHQSRPMVEKQRLADQYISPPQESVSSPQKQPGSSSSSRPYSSYIETTRAGPSTSQQTRIQAPPPRPPEVRPPWPPSRRRVVGPPRSSQHVTPLRSLIQPSAGNLPTQQPPARQDQSHSSRRAVPLQENDAAVIDSSPEPEPFAIPGHIATPSRQAGPQVEVEVEEVDEEEAPEEEDEEEEAFGRVWDDGENEFLISELEEAAPRGITRDDLEGWSIVLECSVSEVRRQISILQKEGLWQGPF